nr:DUF6582 domain-containing protein [Mycobacterium eburneum]
MKVGRYDLSTGPFEVTPERIQDTIKAHEAGVLRKPVVRLGHNDARFSGDPAVGWVDNVRASEDGTTLYGDLVGVPQWLADIMPSAYPSLSIEGMYDYTAPDGSEHPFILTGLALLGATAPGIDSLQSVQDVAKLYGVDDVAVAAAVGQIGGTAVKFTVEASTYRDRTSAKEPWGDVDYADPGYLDENDQPAEPGHGVKRYPLNDRDHVKSAWDFINQKKNAKLYTAEQLAHVKGAIESAAKKFGIQIEAAAASEEKGSIVALPEKLAAALGIDASADEDAISAAWDAHVAAAEQAKSELVAASAPPEGVVQLDKSQYDDLIVKAEAGQRAEARQIAEDRERTVMAAIKDGRISPASKADWIKALEVDPGGHNKTALASLKPGLIPVSELGHNRPDDEAEPADRGLESVHDRVMASLGLSTKKGVN